MKKKLIVGIVFLLFLMAFSPVQAELQGYAKGSGYEYVLLGSYPYEQDGTEKPVLWRVLTVENDQALLLTEYIIDTKQIIFESDPKVIENHSFRRISAYAESDLYTWLNSEGVDTLLGQEDIRAALIEEPGLGLLFPLTQEQYMDEDTYGFSKGQWGEELNAYPRRQAVSTPYARANGLYVERGNGKSPYWCVAIKGAKDYKFGLVGYNGHISWGAYTNIKVGGLRLAVRLDLNKIAVSGGLGTQDSPYLLAFTGETAVPAAEPDIAETEKMQSEEESVVENEPAPTEEPEAVQEEKNGVTLSFVGDCSIGDSIQYKGSETSYHKCIDTNGYAWPFSLVKQYLEADDLTLANLEVVFTHRTRHTDKLYNLVADPDHVQALVEGSIEMVNTVNNHCMDFEDSGYVDTLNTLEEEGILYFGSVYPTKPEGHDDLGVADVGDIRFGFVGFSYPQDSDQKRIANRIQTLRDQGCDVVIVSLHWGRETFMTPEPWQVAYAKQVIAAGADMIWGHHPHVIQPIQFYQGKPILFSTGNFTFGTMSRVDPSTGIFQVTYERVNGKAELKELRVIPCQTQGSPDFRPYELTDPADRQAVFTKLTLKKEYNNMSNPPASFLDTGIIRFENGQMLP